jgi:hypothetical protein
MVSWRDQAGAEHHLAVRGGMLEVRGGEAITVATREAIASDDLHHLTGKVERIALGKGSAREGAVFAANSRSIEFCPQASMRPLRRSGRCRSRARPVRRRR